MAASVVTSRTVPSERRRPRRSDGKLLLDLRVDSKVYDAAMTTTLLIKEVAQRSGFTPTALRFYEDIGLLPQAARSAAGYRQYDERVLDRLAFIARAKQLRCSLEEISDLAMAWDGGRCGPVQDRLSQVVTGKLADTRRQIAELMVLADELEHAAASLGAHRPEGPCDDRCGCTTDDAPSDGHGARPVAFGRRGAA
jgi:DNA-binding transcriptional MerR regulator